MADRENNEPGGGFQPWLILLILGAPSVFSMIALSSARDYGESAIITLMVGSPIAGIVAACIFGTRFKRPLSGTHIAAILGMIIVFTIASVALSFAGCFALFEVFGG